MTEPEGASLAQQSSAIVGEMLRRGEAPLVLVPTGSTEQHGPHLPLDTDSVIATAVARGVAAMLGSVDGVLGSVDGAAVGPSVMVAPTVPYGASGEHQSFPGTVSIGEDALTVVVIELVRSLATWAGRIVFVNGHGGNARALAGAVALLVDEGHPVAWVPCGVPGGDAHAGRTETSLMLHLAPDSVALHRAVAGNVSPLAQLMPDLRSGGLAAVSPTGILGDPTGASAAEGAELLGAMVSSVIRRLSESSADGRGLLAPSQRTGGVG